MTPEFILSADWSIRPCKRAVYLADVGQRSVRRIECAASGWSLTTLMDRAATLGAGGSVLVVIDVPLGVPRSYVDVLPHLAQRSFLGFLSETKLRPDLLLCGSGRWTLENPFFRIPAGRGSLTSIERRAAAARVQLYRKIDRRTGAKSPFAISGIPGTVGSSTSALWRELAELGGKRPALWPFDGDLEGILPARCVVLAETYPRAAYATALLDGPRENRARLAVAKTGWETRRAALASLAGSRWIRDLRVTLNDLIKAESDEDDFDALVTAAALLRCVLQRLPLHGTDVDPIAEGGIIGTGSLNIDLPERRFSLPSSNDSAVANGPDRARDSGTTARRIFPCPLPDCTKVFLGSRSGWDAHVASPRRHPSWHPGLRHGVQRKARFRLEFSSFFR